MEAIGMKYKDIRSLCRKLNFKKFKTSKHKSQLKFKKQKKISVEN